MVDNRFELRVVMVALFCVLFSQSSMSSVEAKTWQPAPGHKQMPLWPGPGKGKVPSPIPNVGAETVARAENLVAGKPWTYVTNVSRPTMTVYPPKGKNTGVSVLVFPGGGYKILAMDLEGTEVCEWLNSIGVTGVLLKYRVPNKGSYPKSPVAIQDAQRAIRLMRAHAKEWNIDPNKIGVLGFSAGGHLVAAASTLFNKRLYPPVDGADKLSCRPDFAVPIYPGHLWIDRKRFVLNYQVPVTSKTPPTFILQAQDDPVDPVEHALVYYRALRKAGVPTEMHLYAHGKHAFGLRPTKDPITKWPVLVEKWLGTIGMIKN